MTRNARSPWRPGRSSSLSRQSRQRTAGIAATLPRAVALVSVVALLGGTAACSSGDSPAASPTSAPAAGDARDELIAPITLSVPTRPRAGRLQAAGRAVEGQLPGLGPAPVSSLAPLDLDEQAVAAACGTRHCLYLLASGAVLSAGSDDQGQSGRGGVDGPGPVRAPDGAAGNLTGVVDLAADSDFSMALREDGTVVTWGANDAGQRGVGDTAPHATPTTVRAPSGRAALRHVVGIGADGRTAIALLADGSVMTWGANDDGQLGDGTTRGRALPARVLDPKGKEPLRRVDQVAVAGQYAMALRQDGQVFAWGANERGQLGDGTTRPRKLPAPVGGEGKGMLTGVAAVRAAERFAVAWMRDGTLRSWGGNGAGQLGDGSHRDRSRPAPVLAAAGRPLTGVEALAVGEAFVVAMTGRGTAVAWGAGSKGQLGRGNLRGGSWPAPVLGPDGKPAHDIVGVTAGLQNLFAVTDAG